MSSLVVCLDKLRNEAMDSNFEVSLADLGRGCLNLSAVCVALLCSRVLSYVLQIFGQNREMRRF
jgi:hypothetical protein